MLGNMGPKEKWIWENIHSLYIKLNNALQQENCIFCDFFKIFCLDEGNRYKMGWEEVSHTAEFIIVNKLCLNFLAGVEALDTACEKIYCFPNIVWI